MANIEWWPVEMNGHKWHATLRGPSGGAEIYRDGELVATAPQQYGTHGNYYVISTDGDFLGSTNWLSDIVGITAYNYPKGK